jgi:hypothetical protein
MKEVTNLYPSVRHLPLSEERIRKVVSEMTESFDKDAIGRNIITPIHLEEGDRRQDESDFISLGVSHIVDKIWFVDGVFGDESYGCEGIGSDYGRGLAEAETSHITKCVLDKCKGNRVTFKEEIRPSDILRSLEFLERNKAEAKIILTNIQDHLRLWHHRNMVQNGQLVISRGFSGYNHDIKIEFFRGLPEGMSIVIDPQKIGELWIKKELKNVVNISEIRNDEREKILRDLPSFDPAKLDESVRILAYEVIKVNIVDPNAAVILQKDSDTSVILI